jgi:hypothetical protein
MLIQVRGVSVHAMSGIELSRVRTEFRLRLPEPINKRPLESSGADIVMQSSLVLELHMSGNGCGEWDLKCAGCSQETPERFDGNENAYRKGCGTFPAR